MKYKIIYLIVLLFASFTYAQKYDNNWVLGYHGQNPHPLQNNILIDFSAIPLEITGLNLPMGMSFNATNASISNTEGELLFYTNGIYIADWTHGLMENGDSLSNVGTTYLYKDSGLPIPQGCLILPYPAHDSQYCVLHVPVDFVQGLNTTVSFLFMSIVDMSKNGGLGKVVSKNEVVVEDTLGFGKLTACKHANGRDWWIILQEDDRMNNGVYTLLLTPEGIKNYGRKGYSIPTFVQEPSVGNSIFTPDGTKYIRHDIRFDPWNAIAIYDFDRCSGELVPLEYFELSDTSFLYGGAAVSPDSRYLYCVTNKTIYQFDLLASNIEATKTVVAEFDGHMGLIFESLFGTPQLAPDGSIIVAAAVSDTVMHVIRTPNQPGTACHVGQHAIHLPRVNQKSIPNFPNYRLGPLDGSPCDTLGLDNHPLAGFTWWPEELAVTFSDNSYYRPETWAWDFGDSGTSTERNPLHSYASPGEYYVCLAVSNEYSSDTICHWVQVDTLTTMVDVADFNGLLKKGLEIYPNPASTKVAVSIILPLAKPAVWYLYDQFGRPVESVYLAAGQQNAAVDLTNFSQGLYFWRLVSDSGQLASGKLIILK